MRRPPVTPAPAAPSKIDAPRSANDIAPPAPTRAPAPATRTSRRSTRREADTRRPNKSARAMDRIASAPTATVLAAPAPAPLPSLSASVSGLPAPPAEPAAVVPAPAPPAPPAPAKPIYKDGTYYGWGTSRHGDIQAAVVIQDGRIASATIAQCFTRYSCSVIAKLPRKSRNDRVLKPTTSRAPHKAPTPSTTPSSKPFRKRSDRRACPHRGADGYARDHPGSPPAR